MDSDNPTEVAEVASVATSKLLPVKSKEKYDKCYIYLIN